MATATRVNPTEFAILGLLAEQPRTGYDIKKEAEGRLRHFWSESFGHLYPMLRRLKSRRLVSVRTVAGSRGRPDRMVYSITAAGRRALRGWFDRPPPPPHPRNELLLRLFLGRHAPPEALLRDLVAYRAGLSSALAALRSVEARLALEPEPPADAPYWGLVLSFGTTLYEALVKWSDGAERTLRRSDR